MSTPTETPTVEENTVKPENLEELRQKKQEIDRYLPEIEQKNEICHQLFENIQYEKTKLHTYQQEINIRTKRLEALKTQLSAIRGLGNANSKNQVTEIKTQIIKEKLEELLSQKIPEVGLSNNKKAKNESDENEFKDLVHENICIIYTQYESATAKTKKEEKQSFKISKKTKFKTLKETACQFFRIENPNDYLLTDDSEAILYNEDLEIDEYMKYYSVRLNVFRLVSSLLLRARSKIIPIQENKLKEMNTFKSKSRNEVKKTGQGTGSQYLNEFINDYSGFKPYILRKDDTIPEKEPGEIKAQAKELDTSFIMLLLTIVFMAFTISFIYRGQKDVLLDNKKIESMKSIFDASEVGDIISLGRYFVNKLVIPLAKNEKLPINTNYCDNLFGNNGKFKASDFTNIDNDGTITTPENEFIKVSSLHVILARIPTKECQYSALLGEKETDCYYSRYGGKIDENNFTDDELYTLNQSSIQDKIVEKIQKQMKQYKSSKKAKIKTNLDTLGGNFDGSGHHFDLILNDQITTKDYICLASKMFPIFEDNQDKILKFFMVNEKTRGITFAFNTYFSNEDIFTSNIIHFDLLSTGLVYPTIEILPFIADIYQNGYIVHDLIRLIIIVAMVCLTLIEYVKNSKGEVKLMLKNLISLSFAHLLLMFLLFLSLFIIKTSKCRGKASDFFDKTYSTYKDGYQLAKMEEYSYYLECILLIFVALKILSFTQLFHMMNLFFSSLNTSINMFVQFLVVIIGILFGFAIVGELIWCPFITLFQTYGMSFIAVLLFTMGYYDTNLLVKYNEGWGIVYIIIFYAFNLFIIFALFNSIFAESLRRTIVKHGYPEDVAKEEWTIKDYSFWFLHYLPEKKQANKVAK